VPIRLFFSNSLDSLSEILREVMSVRNLGAESLFSCPRVVIPNPNVQRWLQLQLARRDGSCLDLGVGEMRDTLWNILIRLGGLEEPPPSLSVRDYQLYVFRALTRTLDLSPDDPIVAGILEPEKLGRDLSPIRHYLYGSPTAENPSSLHLWQLSRKLSSLFQEYLHHRYFELIHKWDGWIERKRIDCSSDDLLERSQFRIYEMVQLLRVKDREPSDPFKGLLLFELAQEVFGELGAQPRTFEDPGIPDLHIFGLSQIFSFHQILLHHLSASMNIFVYTFNPCREFWEDVETPFEEYRRRFREGRRSTLMPARTRITEEETAKGEVRLPDESDTYVLRAWGRPGRENIRLLCEIANYDVDWVPGIYTNEDPLSDTVLRRIQRQILTRSPRPYDFKPGKDNSLNVLACPSIFREVETIRQLLIKCVKDDPGLSLNEIAILVPVMSTYKPVIEAILSRKPDSIPFHLVDSTANEDSLYARAVSTILEILRLGATRPRLFKLLRNPCYYEKFGLDSEGVETLLEWCETLNAFHEKTCVADGVAVEGSNSPFGFHQALRRVRLGRIMECDPDLLGTSPEPFQNILPEAPPGSQEESLVQSFSLVVEILELSRQVFNEQNRDLSGGAVTLGELLEDLLEIPSRFPGEESVRLGIRNELQRIKTMAQRMEASDLPPFDSLELLSYYLEESLASTPSTIGKYLGEGVTVAAMRPMRPLPFRVVFVPGLQEGSFPGAPDRSTLDLRLLRRKIGDASRSEKDCYLFLEILTSTREKLFLSYINRDLQKDETYQTCQVLSQLIRCIETDVLPQDNEFPIQEIPLSGSSLDYFLPEARPSLLVNYDLADRLIFLQKQGSWDPRSLLRESPRVSQFLEDLHPGSEAVVELERGGIEHRDTTLKVSIRDLASFLREPGMSILARRYQFYERPETMQDISVREVEPFRSDFGIQDSLEIHPLNQLFEDAKEGCEEWELERIDQYFEASKKGLILKGKMPLSPYMPFLVRKSKEALDERLHTLNAGFFSEVLPSWCRELRIGDKHDHCGGHSRSVLNLPSPTFKIRLEKGWEGMPAGEYTVQLEGSIIPVFLRENSSLLFVKTLLMDPNPKVLHSFCLDAFLFAATLHCFEADDLAWRKLKESGCTRGAAIEGLGASRRVQWIYEFQQSSTCYAYIENLLKDFLEKKKPFYFPYKDYGADLSKIFHEGSDPAAMLREPSSANLPELIRLADIKFPTDPDQFVRKRYELIYSFQVRKGGRESL
jgi:exodeoxyribonuclease V gamma subunit